MENVYFENYEVRSLIGVNHLEDTFKLFDKATSVIFFLYSVKSGKFIFVSKSVKMILGYRSQNFMEGGIDFIASRIHPEDFPIAYAASAEMFGKKKDFSKRVELRIKNNEGDWIWTEIDIVVSNDTNTDFSPIFGTIKDISDQKKMCPGNKVGQGIKLSIDATHISPSNYNKKYQFDNSLRSNSYKKVTRREKEVLKLVADGFSAKEVANKLFISIHTAINHRKNLISKLHVKNTAELIKIASRYFWL